MTEIRYITAERRPRSLFMQVVGFIVGLVVLGVSLVLGFFALAVLFGFVLILGAVIAVRVWWLRRQFAKAAADDDYLDAEYTTVDNRDRFNS